MLEAPMSVQPTALLRACSTQAGKLLVYLALSAFSLSSAYAQSVGNTLKTNETLRSGQYLESVNKQFTATLGNDGLVLIKGLNGSWDWFMPGGRKPDAKRSFVMQGDGNLCLNGPEGSGLWCSYSNRGPGEYFAVLRDSGDLEVYRGTVAKTDQAELLWTSLLKTYEYANRYPDLKAAFGTDPIKLMEHWVVYGRYEGRAPRASLSDDARKNALAVNLDTREYALTYPDLRAAFGFDAQKLLDHYNNFGRSESRYPNKPTADFQQRPIGPVKGGNHLRIGDYITDKEFLVSPNKRWIMFVQGAGNVCVNEAANIAGTSPQNRAWCKNTRRLTVGRYAGYINGRGQLCTQAFFEVADPRQRENCEPMGEGPPGPYYGELQDDGNFVIHKGLGPQDERGAYWDWMSRRPSRGFNIGALAESVARFVVNTANQTAQQATSAANAVAHVTSDSAVTLANETAAAARVVAQTTVDVANQTAQTTVDIANATANTVTKVANDTTKVAVTVGRTVQDGTQVVGKEIVNKGKIVGYAVADVAKEAWSFVNTNCGQIGRKVFPIDRYFQGVTTITGAVKTYGGFVPGSQALKDATDKANQ